MSNLPYTTGLTDEFTTLIPTSVSASEWVNQKGTTNFVLQNAVFSDDTITLEGNNVAWMPITEPTEYTAYILCKTYISDYKSGNWAQIFGCRNGSNRCYVGISRDSSNAYQLRSYTSSTLKNPTMDNWHVITVKRTGGYYYVYADGELIISETNTATTRGDKFMIKSITDKGSTPTVDEAITVYLKYCAIFNIVQTDDQIKENCNQILVDFGLKAPSKNSRLAGTDAVAIAYAIARNQESAAALQELKKAYREGTVNGDNGNDDVTEPYETTDPDEPAKFPHDPNNDGGDGTVNTDDGITDFKKGYWLACSNTPGGELYLYVKLWIEPYYEQSSSGSSRYKNKIWATIYDRDGTEQSTIYCGYQYSWSTFSGREETAVSASISGNALLIKRFVHYISGSSEDFYQSEVIGLTGSVNLYVIKSGNVSPF